MDPSLAKREMRDAISSPKRTPSSMCRASERWPLARCLRSLLGSEISAQQAVSLNRTLRAGRQAGINTVSHAWLTGRIARSSRCCIKRCFPGRCLRRARSTLVLMARVVLLLHGLPEPGSRDVKLHVARHSVALLRRKPLARRRSCTPDHRYPSGSPNPRRALPRLPLLYLSLSASAALGTNHRLSPEHRQSTTEAGSGSTRCIRTCVLYLS